jgi:hypothetical protein
MISFSNELHDATFRSSISCHVAVRSNAFDGAQDINGIEDVVKGDVVERFTQVEIFGISHKKMKFWVFCARAGDHHIADLDAYSGSVHAKKISGLATQFQPLLRLNNEFSRRRIRP